ncbi:MAG: DUF1549 domain-containing protein [Aureliella sp.]
MNDSMFTRASAWLCRWTLGISGCLLAVQANAQTPPADQAEAAPNKVSYARDVEPILRANCQGCHQPAKPQGEFEMTSFARLMAGGESGSAAVVPGKPDDSYLIELISVHDGKAQMPKKGSPLKDSEIELIRKWISQGAVDDRQNDAQPLYTQDNPPRYDQPPVITAIAFSPNGKWLAVSGFHEVLLVDAATWKLSKRLIGLSERIESVAFSSDSARLAVTGGSPGRMGEVQVWDVEKGELLLSHQVTYDTVYGGAFSPDGKLVAFGCGDNTVRAIDAETGEQKLYQGAHEDWVRSCVFAPDGTHLLSAGRDMTVKLTEVATERFVDNVTSITPGALRGGISSLARHPSRNEILVGGSDGLPKVYRVFRVTARRIGDDSNLLRQFPAQAGRISSVAVHPDSSLLAAASTLDRASTLRVYKYNFDDSLPEDVKAVMSKTSGERKPEERKLLEDYLTKDISQMASVDIPETSVYSIAFHPTNPLLAAGSSDGKIRIINATSGATEATFAPAPPVDPAQHQSTSALAARDSNGLPLVNAIDAKAEQERLPKSKLAKLEVEPAQLAFASDRDYAQLLVTAVYEDGKRCDVTRLAKYSANPEAFSVSPSGFVRPKGAREGKITIEFGGMTGQASADAQKLADTSPVDFVHDVNPILSRLGCNQGTCHGAQKGKNGFKLSLRGYDPIEDVRALSDELASRRLNTAAPDASLMLLKPTGLVPHEGGVVLTKDSVYYHTLRQWIASGAKLDTQSPRVSRIEIQPAKPVIELEGAWQQFRITAFYADGSQRDVTREAFIESGNNEVAKAGMGGLVQAVRRGEAPVLARFEGAYAAATLTIMGNRDDFQWQEPERYNAIDEFVAQKWQRMKILPSDVASDAEFLRRVTLDLTGLPPKPSAVRAFLADQRESRLKRAEVIDQLIGSPDYVEHWSNKWADLLQVNSKFLGKEGAEAFRGWIRQQVDANVPYDEFARKLLTASGSNKDNPPASYYKILREPSAIMENTTHLFLAIRFNCNKCHDHPFERWTQDQYYELTAYFAQVGLKRDPASGDRNIGGTAVEGAKPLFEEVVDTNQGETTHERTGKQVQPHFPFPVDVATDQAAPRRQQLAAWVTSEKNPYFARSFVNRLWGYLTGTGLMEPLDDIRAGNPPTNPELLDFLTEEFVKSNFDVEHILRLICNSRTYQLSVAANKWNEDDTLNYSHAKARRLPAEVLYDAVYQVTGAVSNIPGVAPGTRAAALADVAVSLPDGFLNNLGRPVRESACECERSQDLQLGPVMALVSGPTVGTAISDPKCDLPQLATQPLTDQQLIQEIYLRVLSRPATEKEVQAVLQTAGQIELDHQTLEKQLAEREAWWKGELEQREAKRKAELAEAEAAVKAREQEIQPERERLSKEREAKIAAATEALKSYETGALKVANKYLKDRADARAWFPVEPFNLKSTNKAMLARLADRSVQVRGQKGKGTYTFTVRTPLKNIRGIRLEALADADIPGKGPGLAGNGNFVVTEFSVKAAPASDPASAKALKIARATADFQQENFAIEQTFDGNARDQRGWAVSPQGGITHWATFQLAEPVGFDGGTELSFTIDQYHNAEDHRLARFRISLSVEDGEVGLGLPEEFAALETIAPPRRSAENLKDLFAYLKANDAEWKKLSDQLAAAGAPVPPDAQLVELQQRATQLKQPTADDSQLVQLRRDFQSSRTQLEQRRLTLAQDLTWALINSPAFLFNR